MKKLERNLSLTSVIAISIGGMLGSGIFVLPGLAAAKTGPSVWIAYLLAALCILPAALSKSELATAMPSSGGTYLYIEKSFGPLLGTISGIGLWLSLLLKSSFALVGFGAYLLVLVNMPVESTKYVAVAFLALIGLLNIYGVKKVGKVQLIVVTISVLGLLLLLFFGIPRIQPELLTPSLTNGTSGLISTMAFVFVSYAGVTKVAAIAGEIKNPDKNLPRAMIIALLLVTSIYVLVTYTLVGTIPVDQLATDIKPIYTISYFLGGKYFGYAAAAIGVLTLISMANSGVLAASRFPFAMAKDNLLPKSMSRLHEKHLTPVVTIILTCAVMALVILLLDVEKIAKLASAFMVLMFIFVNASLIVLRETAVQWYNPTYKSPMYPIIQLFGIVSGIVLLIYLGLMPFIAIIIIFIVGFLIYFLYGRKNATRKGVWGNYGHKPAKILLNRKESQIIESPVNYSKEYEDLGNANIDESGVVVGLFGNENSPEMLVEMGAAISLDGKIQTVHITEVPDQTFLDAIEEENPTLSSLDRRIKALSLEKNVNIEFESCVTHDLLNTLHTLADQSHCQWMVLGWNGREHDGIFVRNPLGWLIAHVDSNLALFKDKGIRRFNKIVLAVRPEAKSLKTLLEVSNRICRFHSASLTILHVVPNDTSENKITDIIKGTQSYLTNGLVDYNIEVLRSAKPTETISNETAKYDLLVIGTTKEGTWLKVLFNTAEDRYATKSACSVLRLTTQDILK